MGQIIRGGEQFETAIAADYRGQIIRSGIDSGEVDAFARKRVSQPYTLFDSTLRYDKRSDVWNETILGGASSTHDPNQSSVNMTVATASGDSVLRRTRKRFPYQPGKALRNGEPVLTPSGWVAIESLQVGDEVFDGLGNITEVAGVYPQGERELFRLTFDDGSTVDADGDHLWVTLRRHDAKWHKKGDRNILTTKQMLEQEGEIPSVQNRWRMPCCPNLQMPHRPVNIDPYTLGAILGDGGISHSASVNFTTADEEILDHLVCNKITKRHGSKYGYGLLGLAEYIRNYGLDHKNSFTKFVPNEYKFNCESVRLGVLRGLMDTDGWVEKNACTYFGSASQQLTDDVAFLVRSLGGTAKMSKRESTFYYNKAGTKVVCAPSFKLAICMPVNPFALQRKARQWRPKYRTSLDRYVYSIEPIGSGEATCIRVKSDDHTFLTKNHIVTHNSLLSIQSFAGAPLASGLTQEVGLFDDNNGVILRASGTTLQWVVRGKQSGVVTENVVNQDQWNMDRAEWLDFSKANIFVTDLEWLGAGRVRCGFILDGEYYYCHEFLHANNIDSVYMTTAVLPQSYRIANTSATTSGATMKHICSTVASEGGFQPYGEVHTVSPSIGSIPNAAGERIVAGIRMVSGRTDNVIIPVKVDLVTENSTTIKWRLRRNPTTSGVTWAASDNDRGNVETTTSGSFVSGGTVINAGVYFSAGSVAIDVQDGLSLSLGVNASGVSDELFLTVASSGNAKATGMLGWIETL